MTSQLQSPWLTFYDSDGEPLVGAKIRIYEPGTLTPLDAFDDEGATVSDVVSQPFVTNAAGRIPRYFVTQKYRMTVHTSADVLVDDVDDQDPGLPSGFGVSSTVQVAQGGTGATNAAAARSNLGAASASALTTTQDTVTEHETFIDTARNVSTPTRAGNLAKADTVGVSLLTGMTVCTQRVKKTTTTNSTTSTTTPALDTSKPQYSEGTEIFTQAFTPTSATSKIIIRVFLDCETSAASAGAVAGLFKDTNADAIAASSAQQFGSGGNPFQLYMEYEETSGSTSQRTYSVRAGVFASGTLRINASGGSGTLGGIRTSFLEIIEEITV